MNEAQTKHDLIESALKKQVGECNTKTKEIIL